MTPSEINKLVAIASVLIPEVIALGQSVALLIQQADMPEQEKALLRARIRAAQSSVKEWK